MLSVLQTVVLYVLLTIHTITYFKRTSSSYLEILPKCKWRWNDGCILLLPLFITQLVKESGPAHMRTYLTECRCGHLKSEGEGSSKKLSKKRAAEKMAIELKKLPPLSPPPASTKPKKIVTKPKQTKNLIKVKSPHISFSVAGPSEWNSLPWLLCDTTSASSKDSSFYQHFLFNLYGADDQYV